MSLLDELMGVDPSKDPDGRHFVTNRVRRLLAHGQRTAEVPSDIATHVLAALRNEGWEIRVSSEAEGSTFLLFGAYTRPEMPS